MLNQFVLSILHHELFQLNPVPIPFHRKERGANLFHTHTRAAGQGLWNRENTRGKIKLNSKAANLITSFAIKHVIASLTLRSSAWVFG
jgi:hypothetical protein